MWWQGPKYSNDMDTVCFQTSTLIKSNKIFSSWQPSQVVRTNHMSRDRFLLHHQNPSESAYCIPILVSALLRHWEPCECPLLASDYLFSDANLALSHRPCCHIRTATVLTSQPESLIKQLHQCLRVSTWPLEMLGAARMDHPKPLRSATKDPHR